MIFDALTFFPDLTVCIYIRAVAMHLRRMFALPVFVVYVESLCRVLNLSLCARMVYPFVDRMVVQWETLGNTCKEEEDRRDEGGEKHWRKDHLQKETSALARRFPKNECISLLSLRWPCIALYCSVWLCWNSDYFKSCLRVYAFMRISVYAYVIAHPPVLLVLLVF